MMEASKRTEELKEASGSVTYSDPLTTFLYLLMRNDLPAGTVESLVRESINSAEECVFTNGWLAQYAHNLAEELKNAKVNHLRDALDKVFSFEEEARKNKAMEEEKARIEQELEEVSESLTDEELAVLEQRIKEEAFGEEEEEGEEVPATEEAKEAVQQMVEQGHLSKEEAEAITEDIEESARPPAVEVKPEAEGEKLTAEEAKEMVESAVEESKSFFEKLNEEIADKIGKPDIPEVIKNGEVVSNAEWCKEHVTYIEKFEEEEKQTDEE